MNNETVAYLMVNRNDGNSHIQMSVPTRDEKISHQPYPFYTHPVKEQKCVVQDCENHQHEGSFNGDLCSPCYQFIAHGKGIYSQAYRNVHSVKELTDEEILKIHAENPFKDGYLNNNLIEFAKAILRKAQEK